MRATKLRRSVECRTQRRAWAGRPAHVKTHGKKREHGQHSYDFGRERGYLVRFRYRRFIACNHGVQAGLN
jgi:hypothetical protein